MSAAAANPPYTRRLDQLRREDASRFGAKSASLGELLAAEVPVPPGFALSTAAFDRFVGESGLEAVIAHELAGAASGEVEALGAASRAIAAAMRSAPVPDSVAEEVSRRYDELGAQTGVSTPSVAVRSSALGEDSQDATFAGQQDSYLWVRGAANVHEAIRDCWASLYSGPAISYRARLPSAGRERPAMGVAVQLMVDAAVSGVMFTCNPVSGDPSMVAINASWGLGLAVVGGEVTPDDYLVSKVTRQVVRARVSAKPVEYVPDPAGSGTVRIDVAPDRRALPCLDERALRALVDLSQRVQRHFGSHQDIEWVISRGETEPGRLFVVQSRPVTALPERKPAAPAGSAISLVMGTFGAGTFGAGTSGAGTFGVRPPPGDQTSAPDQDE